MHYANIRDLFFLTLTMKKLFHFTRLILPHFIDEKDVLCHKVFRNVKMKESKKTYSNVRRRHKIKPE